MHKWLCNECSKIVYDPQVLKAPHPFMPDTELYGCPYCRHVESLTTACSIDGCNNRGTNGFPTLKGYTWTCDKHAEEMVTDGDNFFRYADEKE